MALTGSLAATGHKILNAVLLILSTLFLFALCFLSMNFASVVNVMIGVK